MRVLLVSVATMALLAGCRASDLAAPASTSALTLTVGSDQLDLPQGLAALTVVNVSRAPGFTGDVTFSVEGVPDGMRALATGIETTDGVTSALLSVGTDRGFPTGVYPLTIHASGQGQSDALGLLTVTVTPAGSGVYALEIRPVSVPRGGQVSTLLSINRADFFDVSIRTTAENVPAGVTVTIYPEDNAKALSNLTVAVARNVAPGEYRLKFRGSTPGLADRIEVVPLTVVPSGP